MIMMDGAQTGGGRFLILQVKCTPPARICLFNSRSGLFKKKNPAPSYGLLTTIYRMNGVVSDGSFYHSNSSLHLSPSATLNQQAGGWSFSRGSIPAPTAPSVETSDKMRRHPHCSPGPVRPDGWGPASIESKMAARDCISRAVNQAIRDTTRAVYQLSDDDTRRQSASTTQCIFIDAMRRDDTIRSGRFLRPPVESVQPLVNPLAQSRPDGRSSSSVT